MVLPPIVLASASPRRALLMRQLDMDFQIVPGNAEEAEHDFMSPREVCQLNAFRKARIVAKQYPDALVIGADTEVCLNGRIFGKPKDMASAFEMLKSLQGQTHEVITGVCLMHLRLHRERLLAVTTKVTFRKLSDEGIHDYLGKIAPLDKAGAYAIQDHGYLIIRRVRGSYSNVVGLPLERLLREFRHFKIKNPVS